MKIGILSIQGGVIEHINHIKALGHEALEVKKSKDLNDIDGLILPGGESTTIGKLLRDMSILGPLKEKISSGLPVWGTCAGMILLAKSIENDDRRHIQAMDISVKRNAYGRQLDSFVVDHVIQGVSDEPIPLVFIRAPYIVKTGENVEILHRVNDSIVAAKQDNILVTSFHPELSNNLEFHRYFVSMCQK
ncbi:pyridoxal 5'-phosphate synthase glutaminase subunit PdxT [Clostridium cylindrosporum]|uniref:Pyridoxal 5'-phosphate synthase subunit PdxT n=1 Tax=Clostridium cylindrosporum DSM 605 TaxID=1121307 RepID=A0A0J8G708_CLOCY|nr:pyridoxal 5'-phosphate synthase glutaminase subunit PdxT [Clostridium cylindrosporum]KMT23371.1 glutamine amidotransferase subunit PdxT [Clostridium cylindrosporum DSM 605]